MRGRDRPSAEVGDDRARIRKHAAHDALFRLAKRTLADREQLGDRLPGRRLDDPVDLHEHPVEPACDLLGECRLAGAHEPDERDVLRQRGLQSIRST